MVVQKINQKILYPGNLGEPVLENHVKNETKKSSSNSVRTHVTTSSHCNNFGSSYVILQFV